MLLVHHCKGVDIYIRGKSEPLTEQLRIHLQYKPPLPEDRTEFDEREEKYNASLERLIWDAGTQIELVGLLKAGFKPPNDERLQAKAKRAQKVMDARHQREVDREAQRQQSERRKQQRAAKAERKGTRPPLINKPMPTKPVAVPGTYDEWITKQIEDLLLRIEVSTVIQPKTSGKPQ